MFHAFSKKAPIEIAEDKPAQQLRTTNQPKKRFKFGETKPNQQLTSISTNQNNQIISYSRQQAHRNNNPGTSWTNNRPVKPDEQLAITSADNQEKPTRKINITPERFLTGSPDLILDWFSKDMPSCFYEVVCRILKVLDGNDHRQRVFLVRGQYGRVMKISFFDNDNIKLNQFAAGVWIRCVGKKHDFETLRAFSVRNATPKEIAVQPRVTGLCKQEIELMM